MAALEIPLGVPDAVERERPSWMAQAICRGRSELFFAPRAERPSARERREAEAAELCARCPVRVPCRSYARTYRELGFWGGENEVDRALAGYPPTTPLIGLPRPRRPAQRASGAVTSPS